MSANASQNVSPTQPVAKSAPTEQQESQPGVPKKIVNAQTVCNEKNEKGKLCNGHLKQLKTGGEPAEAHLRGNDVLFKCQTCGTLYMGPPLGHLRDPDKQQRFVERELTALLQAAGGTLPAIVKNERGVYVLAEESGHGHGAQAAKPAPTATAPAKPAQPAVEKKPVAASAAPKPAATEAKPAPAPPAAETSGEFVPYVPPPAPGPVPGETQEQKLARLRAIVAEAKRRKALAGGDMSGAGAKPVEAETAAEPSQLARDSSTSADAHRPAAEAQAATGQASAVPLSPAAATASPAAGAETVEDLAPEASTELTPGAPPAAEEAPKTAAAKPVARTATGTVKRADYDLGPQPGETHEQKIARLTAMVEEIKRRAGKL